MSVSLDREPRKMLITARGTPPRTTPRTKAGLGEFCVVLRTDGWETLVQNMIKLFISHTRVDSTHQNHQVFMGGGRMWQFSQTSVTLFWGKKLDVLSLSFTRQTESIVFFQMCPQDRRWNFSDVINAVDELQERGSCWRGCLFVPEVPDPK